MHACGHDGHTASLLILAKAFNQMKDDLEGTIVFIHQHAEELAPGGAISMIRDGRLEGVDVIFGTHLWAPTDLGKVQTAKGPLMAQSRWYLYNDKGKGGHGSNQVTPRTPLSLRLSYYKFTAACGTSHQPITSSSSINWPY